MYQKRLKVFDEIESLSDDSLADFYNTAIRTDVEYEKLNSEEKKKLDEIAKGFSERTQSFLYSLCFEGTLSYNIVKELKYSNSRRRHISGLARDLKSNKGTLYPYIRELLKHKLIVVDPYCGGERHTIYKPSGLAEEDGFDSLWSRLTKIAEST